MYKNREKKTRATGAEPISGLYTQCVIVIQPVAGVSLM